MTEARMNRRPAWLTFSAMVLIAANLVPLAGTILFKWTVFEVVLLFWAENVIIGALNVLRMLTASAGDAVSWMMKIFLIPFFVFHYGMFTLVHGVFVFGLFGGENFGSSGTPDDFGPMFESMLQLGLAVPLLALFSSHAFSFVWNYLGRGEYKNADLRMLMTRPYGRIVVLHITIIIGGFLVMSLGSPLAGLVFLILLKVGFDLRAHSKEHREKLKAEVDDEPTFKEILARLNEAKRRAGSAPVNASAEESRQEP